MSTYDKSKYEAEIHQPTVLLNIPEVARLSAARRGLRWLLIGVSTVAFASLTILIAYELWPRSGALPSHAITLTVKLRPSVEGAEITVDGTPLRGMPATAILPPSPAYRTLVVRAPGFAEVQRDVQLLESRILTIDLEPLDTTQTP